MQKSKPRNELAEIPATADSPRAKLVCLALETGGPATVDDLHDRLDESRLALLSVLDTLTSRGVVDEDGREYALA